MSETRLCPHCGSRPIEEAHGWNGVSAPATSSLAVELRRIREIAETREAHADKQRIDELDREVRQLRETVARLRGSAAPVHGYR
jgi:hypothetical protein